MIKEFVQKIKDWSGWDRAGTIVKARLEALIGIITAGIAGLIAFDWMPFVQEGIDWTKAAMVGGYLFVSGIVSELVRRSNTKVIAGQLVPKDIEVKHPQTKTKKKK